MGSFRPRSVFEAIDAFVSMIDPIIDLLKKRLKLLGLSIAFKSLVPSKKRTRPLINALSS